MNLQALRAVAAIDALNVVALLLASPRHGAAAAAGYAPALTGTMLVHRSPRLRSTARALCVVGLIPDTALSLTSAGAGRRERMLSSYVAVGGALLGLGYLLALSNEAA